MKLRSVLPALLVLDLIVVFLGIAALTPAGAQDNVQPVQVNLGPRHTHVNGLFTSVTLCQPGTAQCQTINNMLVDTGSFGVRVFKSQLKLDLPIQAATDGGQTGECAAFVGFYTWGPIELADLNIAGEVAASLPVQVIDPRGFARVPAGCLATGLPAATVASLGANGILGIGSFVSDCGAACAVGGPANAGLYYSCAGGQCAVTAESIPQQVQNPVPLFAFDNNGIILSLPAIGASGAPAVSGSLIFGIGTRANNTLSSAQVFTVDSLGNLTTILDGNAYPGFIDSGSNANFFLSSAAAQIRQCRNSAFYCPAGSRSFSAENVGVNGTAGAVDFTVANARSLFATSRAAFSNLGGADPGGFDWGLPFFFGRDVFVAIDGQDTPGGPGPYWAY